MRPDNIPSFVPIILLAIITVLFLPSICLSQSHDLADQYWRQAESLSKEGRYLEAALIFEKSAIAEQASPEPRLADLVFELSYAGINFYHIGKYDKAIEHFKEAKKIGRKLGMEAQVAMILNNIGMLYQSWGQYNNAIEHYKQAIEIGRKLGRDEDIATYLNNIGLVYKSWGQYDKAIEHYKQALKIFKKLGREAEGAALLNNIGGVYNSLGQYDKAIDYYKQALKIGRKLGRQVYIAGCLNNIATVYKSWGQYDKAIEHFKQALQIDRKLGREAQIAKYLNNIGSVYGSLDQYDKAIDYYKQSIQLIEKIRRTAKGDIRRDYLASQIVTYQSLASAAIKQGDPQEVLDAVEQSRARVLAEQIAGINSELEIPTLTEVQKGLAENEAILLFANMDQDNFILMVISGKDVAMQIISKEDFLAKSQKQYKKPLLNPILMILEKSRGMKIKKGKDDKIFEEQKLQSDFATAIHYYRTLLGCSPKSDCPAPVSEQEVRDFSKLLHSLLIEPVSDKLAGKTKITVMADGILGFLPFESLVNEKNNYLTKDYDLHYTQSLTIDRLLQQRDYTGRNDRKPLLAFGGAVYDKIKYASQMIENSQQLSVLHRETDQAIAAGLSTRNAYTRMGITSWKNLPGTLKEVKDISFLIKDSKIVVGDQVTEEKIKQDSKVGHLASYKVLHFATHGLSVPEMPELSAIVLSQFKNEQNSEDGYLRMGEIAKLDIAADFVNLSACETGVGKIYGGEGIVGLTQSFLIAGANGLSVSLWVVADDSTAKFMTELYKKVQDTGMGYNQAITEVKRAFINGDYGKEWKKPYYWAPFVYYGK